MRPSTVLFVWTSTSTGRVAKSGRTARSIGMFTSENAVTFCGRPSSSTSKSSARKSDTRLPWASATSASTST